MDMDIFRFFNYYNNTLNFLRIYEKLNLDKKFKNHISI